MAKNIKKYDKEIQSTERKLEKLRKEKRAAEEKIFLEIGKKVVQQKRLDDKNKALDDILEEVKLEVELAQEEQKKTSNLAISSAENNPN